MNQTAKEVLGKKHPNNAVSNVNLAYLYVEQGRYAETQKLYEKALLIQQEMLGKNHKRTIETLDGLKYVRYKLKEE